MKIYVYKPETGKVEELYGKQELKAELGDIMDVRR